MEYSAVSNFQMKAFLGSRIRCRSQLAVALVCVAGLGNVRMLPHAVRSFAVPPPTRLRSWPRFEPLCSYLPADAKVGFLPDPRRANGWSAYPDRQLFLAQSFVGASTVGTFRSPPLGDRQLGGLRKPARNRCCGRLDLVADLHNGVRLYTAQAENSPCPGFSPA